MLGYFNFFGIETNKNKKEAFDLFSNRLNENHVLSQYYVGLYYKFGYGVAKGPLNVMKNCQLMNVLWHDK